MEREKNRGAARASLPVGDNAEGDIPEPRRPRNLAGNFPQATCERALSGTQPL